MQARTKLGFTVFLHVLMRTYFNACIYKFWLFIQYVVIINAVNYPERFCQTQFTHGRITITINFANSSLFNIVLNIVF